MPPVPTRPNRPAPKLHLQVLDLGSAGSARFFAALATPQGGGLGRQFENASDIVLSLLYPSDYLLAAAPAVRSVTLHLREFDGVAHTCGSQLDNDHKELHFSTQYIAGLSGDAARILGEIQGVIVHELVHVWQHNGGGTCPGGVIEGIADWVRLKAFLAPPHWRKGSGDRWDQGYDVTAYFLEYLSDVIQDPNFVPTLNLKLTHGHWNDGLLLKELLGGRDVETLWRTYKQLDHGV